ncbi:hypothetical protein QE364_000312 [Nocardioides zeae]|uniref:Lipoprotein n=2 Tax=Nocardioides zeae TaxID=1457234 RepID=A0AAJ1U350_9ACTN|nr:hypothetical protein [Nocardioides zeae]MDQ1104613.1 hypothetical protein [Nocardioides zeae]MDR6175695.1 hypothetical protein [Nocardioides zeae]MDR6208624.1 hypothetical protein [Nocardioides zeae]
MRRTMQGRRLRAAAAVAAALVLTLGACGDDGDDDARVEDPPSSASSTDPGDEDPGGDETDEEAEEPAEDLPAVDPGSGFTAGDVCRGEATLEGTQPFPDDPAQISALLLLETLPFPDATTDEPYVPVTTSFDWSVPGATDLTNVNAIVCMSVVPDSIAVRKKCDEPVYPDLQPDAWEVWSSDYVVSVVDPTTAEVLVEGEPFSSADFLPVDDVGCEVTAPVGGSDAAYGYSSDLPTIRYWGAKVDETVQQLY